LKPAHDLFNESGLANPWRAGDEYVLTNDHMVR